VSKYGYYHGYNHEYYSIASIVYIKNLKLGIKFVKSKRELIEKVLPLAMVWARVGRIDT
jgi:hypothetical protein